MQIICKILCTESFVVQEVLALETSEWVEFNAPPDTMQVILETLCDNALYKLALALTCVTLAPDRLP